MFTSTLSRSLFRRSAVPSLAAPARSGPSSSIRSYGSTGGEGSSKSHGGQAPTERNMGETGSAAPSSDMVAKSDAAFDGNADPASSTQQVEKDLPAGESMDNTAANSTMSKQFGKGKTDAEVPDTQASGKNTSESSDGGRRSARGPGQEV